MRSNSTKSQNKVQSTHEYAFALPFYGAAKAPIKYDKKNRPISLVRMKATETDRCR